MFVSDFCAPYDAISRFIVIVETYKSLTPAKSNNRFVVTLWVNVLFFCSLKSVNLS